MIVEKDISAGVCAIAAQLEADAKERARVEAAQADRLLRQLERNEANRRETVEILEQQAQRWRESRLACDVDIEKLRKENEALEEENCALIEKHAAAKAELQLYHDALPNMGRGDRHRILKSQAGKAPPPDLPYGTTLLSLHTGLDVTVLVAYPDGTLIVRRKNGDVGVDFYARLKHCQVRLAARINLIDDAIALADFHLEGRPFKTQYFIDTMIELGGPAFEVPLPIAEAILAGNKKISRYNGSHFDGKWAML